MASFDPPRLLPWELKQALTMCLAANQTADEVSALFRSVAHDIKSFSASTADDYGGKIALGSGSNAGEQYTFIALSGTSNLKAVLTNFAESPTSTSASEVGAHKAFLERSTSIPFDYLIDAAAKGKLVITGHSLGGACATLLTAAFVQKYVDRNFVKSVRCITFGSPLVCQSPSFCAYMSPFRGLFTHYVSEKDSIAISLSSRRVLSDYGFVNDNQSDEQGALEPFGTHIKLGLVQATGRTAAIPLSLEETTAHFAHSGTLSLAVLKAEFETRNIAHSPRAYQDALRNAAVIADSVRSSFTWTTPGKMEAVNLQPDQCILRGNRLEIYGKSMWLVTSVTFAQTGATLNAVRGTEKVVYFVVKDVSTVPVEATKKEYSLRLALSSPFNIATKTVTLSLTKADIEDGLMPDALVSRLVPLYTLAIFDASGEGTVAREHFLDLCNSCNNIITNIPIEFAFCVIGRKCEEGRQSSYGKFVKMLLHRLEEVDMDPESLVSVTMINVLAEAIAKLKTLSPVEKESLNNAGIFSSQASLLSPKPALAAVPPGFHIFRQVSIPGRQMFYASGIPIYDAGGLSPRRNFWRMVYEQQIGVSLVLSSEAWSLVRKLSFDSCVFHFGAANDEEVCLQLKKSGSIGGIIYRMFEMSCDLGYVALKYNFYLLGVDDVLNQKTFNAMTVLLKTAPFDECLATTGLLHVMSESSEEISAFALSDVACNLLNKRFDERRTAQLATLTSQLGDLSGAGPVEELWSQLSQRYIASHLSITKEVRGAYASWTAKEELAETRLITYLSCLKRDMYRTHKRIGASYFCGQSISMVVRSRATEQNEPFFSFIPATQAATAGFTKSELINLAHEISDASQFLSLLLEGAVQRASVHLDEPDSVVKIAAKALMFPVSTLVNTMYGIGNLGLFLLSEYDEQYLVTARNNFVDSWHAIAYSQRLLASYEEILKAICDKAKLKNHIQSSKTSVLDMEDAIARSVAHCNDIVQKSVSDLCKNPRAVLVSSRYECYVNEHRNVSALLFFLKLAYCSWKIRNTRKKFTVVTIGGKNNGGKTTLIDELFPGKLAPEDKPGGAANRVTIFPRAFSLEADPFTIYIDLPGITDSNTFKVARMMALCGNVTVFVLESLMSKSDNNEVNIESIKEFLTQKKGPGLICINQFDRNLLAVEPTAGDSDDDEDFYNSDGESDIDTDEAARATGSSRTPHRASLRSFMDLPSRAACDSDEDSCTGGVDESKGESCNANIHPAANKNELDSDDDADVDASSSNTPRRNSQAPTAPAKYWDLPAAGEVSASEAEYERRLLRIVKEEAEAWKKSAILNVNSRLVKRDPLECERGHERRVLVETGHKAVHPIGCGCGCADAVVFSGIDANGWRTSIWLTCFDRKSRTDNRNSKFVDQHVFSAADVQSWVLEAKNQPNAFGFVGYK